MILEHAFQNRDFGICFSMLNQFLTTQYRATLCVRSYRNELINYLSVKSPNDAPKENLSRIINNLPTVFKSKSNGQIKLFKTSPLKLNVSTSLTLSFLTKPHYLENRYNTQRIRRDMSMSHLSADLLCQSFACKYNIVCPSVTEKLLIIINLRHRHPGVRILR